jgi:hypothetical protein
VWRAHQIVGAPIVDWLAAWKKHARENEKMKNHGTKLGSNDSHFIRYF